MTTILPRRPPKLDEIDHQLIELLRKDGRTGNRELARALGVADGTIHNRIRRLCDADVMHGVALVDIEAAGHAFYIQFWIQVEGRPILEVAREIAALNESLSVVIVLGSYDIFATLIARDREHLRCVIAEGLNSIQGISRLDSTVAIDCLLCRSRWVAFTTRDLNADQRLDLASDDLDAQIIRCLQVDGRMSNREIGRQLQVSESAVRTHIKQLEERGAMRVVAVTNLLTARWYVWSFVGVFVERGRLYEVAEALTRLEEVHYVAVTFGTFDIVVTVLVDSRSHLLSVLRERIIGIPGVRRAETTEALLAVKHNYTLVPSLVTGY
jgi:Lrp/AsnC family transcriptional regulator for asnA, asnC and gidA